MQRDLLRKQKDEKRQAELDQFNDKFEPASSSKSMADQMRDIDKGTTGPNNAELEKRRAIYQQVRKDITADEQKKKQNNYTQKMD
jgi:hypothetical protein